MNTVPWISPQFDLTLDSQPALMAIEQLNFSQMKRKPHSPSLAFTRIQIKINIDFATQHSFGPKFQSVCSQILRMSTNERFL